MSIGTAMNIHQAIATELTHLIGGRLKGYRAATESFQDDLNQIHSGVPGPTHWGVSIWRKHRRLVGVLLHAQSIGVGNWYNDRGRNPKFQFFEYDDPELIDKILEDVAGRVAQRSCRPARAKVRYETATHSRG